MLRDRQLKVFTLDKNPSSEPEHIRYRLGSYEGLKLPEVDAVIHLASESHVDRSISGPQEFIDNNVKGTLELYETCRHFPNLKQILQFSTDEVGACLPSGELVEEYKFNTGSVYSASKGAQELLSQAYIKTFDLPVIITRCVNIFGTHQADEKFIPTICRNAALNKAIPIYGNGLQMRQWVSVKHVCEFVAYVATSSFIPPGSLLHITGTKEIYNILLARSILSILGKPASLISHVKDRLGHDVRYALGRTDETDRYGVPVYDEGNFLTELEETVQWYRGKYE